MKIVDKSQKKLHAYNSELWIPEFFFGIQQKTHKKILYNEKNLGLNVSVAHWFPFGGNPSVPS